MHALSPSQRRHYEAGVAQKVSELSLTSSSASFSHFGPLVGGKEIAVCVTVCVHVEIFQVGAGMWGECEPTLDQQAKEAARAARGSFLFGNLFCFLNVRVSRWRV